MTSRRRATIQLNEDDLITLLGLPLGYEVIGVFPDYHRFSIDVVVTDESLEVVVEGTEPPILPGKLKRNKQGVLSWESSEYKAADRID